MESASQVEFQTFLLSLEKKLRVTRFQDNAKLGLEHVELSVDHPSIIGTGSADDLELATLKAISEFAERAAYSFFKEKLGLTSTNGLAAHSVRELALKNAALELIERDAFISCWLLRLYPNWVPKAQLPEIWRTRLQRLEEVGISARFGIQAMTGQTMTGVGILIPTPEMSCKFGFAVTSAAAGSLSEVADRLWTDFGRYSGIIIHRLDNGLPSSRVTQAEDISKPSDHLEWSLAARRQCPALFLKGAERPVVLPEIPVDVSVLFQGHFMDCPIVVASAKSSEAQGYYSGRTRSDRICWNRLKRIRPNLTSEAVNMEVHPLP